MLRKYHEVKWTVPTIFYFDQIKKVIFEGPILASPNNSQPFSIFSFSSKTTLVVVILQNNKDGDDQPIEFFNKVMRDVELKYDIIEK